MIKLSDENECPKSNGNSLNSQDLRIESSDSENQTLKNVKSLNRKPDQGEESSKVSIYIHIDVVADQVKKSYENVSTSNESSRSSKAFQIEIIGDKVSFLVKEYQGKEYSKDSTRVKDRGEETEIILNIATDQGKESNSYSTMVIDQAKESDNVSNVATDQSRESGKEKGKENDKDSAIVKVLVEESKNDSAAVMDQDKEKDQVFAIVTGVVKEIDTESYISGEQVKEIDKDSTIATDLVKETDKDSHISREQVKEIDKDSHISRNQVKRTDKDPHKSGEKDKEIDKESTIVTGVVKEIDKDSHISGEQVKEIDNDSYISGEQVKEINKDSTKVTDLVKEIDKDSIFVTDLVKEIDKDYNAVINQAESSNKLPTIVTKQSDYRDLRSWTRKKRELQLKCINDIYTNSEPQEKYVIFGCQFLNKTPWLPGTSLWQTSEPKSVAVDQARPVRRVRYINSNDNDSHTEIFEYTDDDDDFVRRNRYGKVALPIPIDNLYTFPYITKCTLSNCRELLSKYCINRHFYTVHCLQWIRLRQRLNEARIIDLDFGECNVDRPVM
ncbi:nipped-B-like protein B [Drosophila eugracilis]|uniref:nipped-B-like protein B n=1 Tax=Drosophila eugracilis TaxID=29029 RepID=UPI0007E7FE3D|nr:nipped-B-like protein B [Drosophila eugracilis]